MAGQDQKEQIRINAHISGMELGMGLSRIGIDDSSLVGLMHSVLLHPADLSLAGLAAFGSRGEREVVISGYPDRRSYWLNYLSKLRDPYDPNRTRLSGFYPDNDNNTREQLEKAYEELIAGGKYSQSIVAEEMRNLPEEIRSDYERRLGGMLGTYVYTGDIRIPGTPGIDVERGSLVFGDHKLTDGEAPKILEYYPGSSGFRRIGELKSGSIESLTIIEGSEFMSSALSTYSKHTGGLEGRFSVTHGGFNNPFLRDRLWLPFGIPRSVQSEIDSFDDVSLIDMDKLAESIKADAIIANDLHLDSGADLSSGLPEVLRVLKQGGVFVAVSRTSPGASTESLHTMRTIIMEHTGGHRPGEISGHARDRGEIQTNVQLYSKI